LLKTADAAIHAAADSEDFAAARIAATVVLLSEPLPTNAIAGA